MFENISKFSSSSQIFTSAKITSSSQFFGSHFNYKQFNLKTK